MATKGGGNEEIKRKLEERILNAMLPYVEGWVRTIGEVGAPPQIGRKENGVAPRDRSSAAKTGLEMVNKLIGQGASPTGGDLLKALQELESVADSGEGGDWPQDSELPPEATDLE